MTTLHITGGSVLIDEADIEAEHTVEFQRGIIWRGSIAEVTWRAAKKRHTTYAVCNIGSLELRMHRVILDAKLGQLVDHQNGNGLDNTRQNLRIATERQNAQHRRKYAGVTLKGGITSVFKGVSKHKQTGKFEAAIRVGKIKKHLGLYASEVEAALAYNVAAMSMFGEFAVLNPI